MPDGFRLAGLTKSSVASDHQKIGIIVADGPATAAAVLTRNIFSAPPIHLCRERLAGSSDIRGVVVNSGNANAATGKQGERAALTMTRAAEKATGAPRGSFLVASTGVIGQLLKTDKVSRAIERTAKSLSATGWNEFSRAIMTTDLVPKLAGKQFSVADQTFSILGTAKGSGMIQPNMATMLAFICTDYPIGATDARLAIRKSADLSFNCLSVDGQTSTNDMALLLSSGAAPLDARNSRSGLREFQSALTEICQDLTRQLAADGEGATKLLTVRVSGARSEAGCKTLALEVANSSLVKTAVYGEDPNWGRIIQALGKARVRFDPALVRIRCQGTDLMRHGAVVKFSRAAVAKAMKAREIELDICVGAGKTSATVWTCDLTHKYIDINVAYN